MGRKTMQFGLRTAVLDHLRSSTKNRRTKQSYMESVTHFATWAKAVGHKYFDQLNKDVIQEYADHLRAEGKTAGTIHTRLAPVCVGAGISMREIRKPRRTIDTIVRGRSAVANEVGHRQKGQERYSRLVVLQEALGIRRAELAALTPEDAVRDENGTVVAVIVRHGKGGKRQEQRVLPGRRDAVTRVFNSAAGADRVFSGEEMANKINLHGMRAAVAQEAYGYYAGILKEHPEAAGKMRSELMQALRDNNTADAFAKKRRQFTDDITNENPYRLRGATRAKAVKLGLPTEYNRLSLMMVSVFHLAHWRINVTTANYLLAMEEGDTEQ